MRSICASKARRLAALALCFVLCLAFIPAGTAANAQDAHPCGHVCNGACGGESGADGSGCTHIHDETCGFSIGSPCAYVHTHDKSCGYAIDSPCAYVHTHDKRCGFSIDSPCIHAHTHDASCGFFIDGSCVYGHVHDQGCGYVAGNPCAYEHTHNASCGYTDDETPCADAHVHDQSCGYIEAVPCAYVHEHDESCGYSKAAPCQDVHVHDQSCGYSKAAPCKDAHVHDASCGYLPPAPCTHVCTDATCPRPACAHICVITAFQNAPPPHEPMQRRSMPTGSSLQAVLNSLPTRVSAYIACTSEWTDIPVKWTCASYKRDTAGVYRFAMKLDESLVEYAPVDDPATSDINESDATDPPYIEVTTAAPPDEPTDQPPAAEPSTEPTASPEPDAQSCICTKPCTQDPSSGAVNIACPVCSSDHLACAANAPAPDSDPEPEVNPPPDEAPGNTDAVAFTLTAAQENASLGAGRRQTHAVDLAALYGGIANIQGDVITILDVSVSGNVAHTACSVLSANRRIYGYSAANTSFGVSAALNGGGEVDTISAGAIGTVPFDATAATLTFRLYNANAITESGTAGTITLTISDGTTEKTVALTIDRLASQITASVPLQINVTMNESGEFAFPSAVECVITNNSAFPIQVDSIVWTWVRENADDLFSDYGALQPSLTLGDHASGHTFTANNMTYSPASGEGRVSARNGDTPGTLPFSWSMGDLSGANHLMHTRETRIATVTYTVSVAENPA